MSATRIRTSSDDLDEVQWLLDAGESPAQIALRIGRSATTIEKAARRHRRTEMAAVFGRESDWTRRHAA